MAKKSYKIPTSLDKSPLDIEINLQNKNGIGPKPIPVRLVFSYVLSFLVCFFLLTRSFIAGASIGIKIVFVLLWILLTVVLLIRDETGISQFSLVASMFNYLPKRKRHVITRRSSNPYDFQGISGIKNITETGLIEYVDDTYGYMYEVVGSASVLLFESDTTAILDRVDSFWRKIKTDSEWIFFTVKEPQKIYTQVANLKDRYDNLNVDNKDLKGLLDAQYKILTNIVGKEYKTVHQYLIIKSDSLEMLKQAKNTLQNEVEYSSWMFKRCTALYKEDIETVLASVYQGIDKN